jgi:phage terminase large subunit GpA-like protein
LSPEASAEPGQWITARAEYQRGIMDAVTDPAVEAVVVKSSAQVGKTEIVNNAVGYYIDQDPSPILLLQPTLDMAEAYSKDRLAPMIRDTPCLAEKVQDARSRNSGNTLLHKSFHGGHVTMAGANSPSSLASRPIRIAIFDEVDRYPASAGTEGDPVDLGWKRTTTFWNRKRLETSTPTVEGLSRIDASYQASDQRRYFVPCSACGAKQTLEWAQVRWDEGKPETARYACAHCPSEWGDAERWRAIQQGEWIAGAEFRGVAGFHLWEAYSPWVPLAQIASNFLKAKDSPERLRTWVNTSLGETWKERGEAPEWQRLYERRESYPLRLVPSGGLFLTAGADVQKDRIEVQVIAWGRGKESWCVDYVVFDGDTSAPPVWTKVSEFLDQTYHHDAGIDLPVIRFAIDSGFATQDVYAWARRQGPGRVMVVKGVDGGVAIVGQPTAVDVKLDGKKFTRGVRVWPVNSGVLKSEFYGWLRLDKPTAESGDPYPPGYCHYPEFGEEFFRQLTAEQLVTKVVRGYRRQEWVKQRERNEALDTRVYARAAASLFGIDRFQERQWKQLEDNIANARMLKPAGPEPPAGEQEESLINKNQQSPSSEFPAKPIVRQGGWIGPRRGGGWLRK